MADMTQLMASCDAVVERMRSGTVKRVTCPLCEAVQTSQDDMCVHFFTAHKVRLVDPVNVTDLDKLLSIIATHVFGDSRDAAGVAGEAVRCPVCGEDVQPLSEEAVSSRAAALRCLETHITDAGHSVWNSKTIPALAPFVVPVLDDGDEAPEANDDRQKELDGDQDEWEAADDLDEGWEEPIQCLYCSEVSPSCLEHMRSAHAFDLPAATRQHPGVKDEYDVIRLINAVRGDWQHGKCPGCEFCGTTTEREAHLRECPSHRLPAAVPTDDALLRPVLPGDSLLSLVVTAGEGFLPCEEDDPDFPMVPTVHERAARQRP